MKRCSKCGSEKELAQFSRDVTKRDGLCSSCKQCQKAYFDKRTIASGSLSDDQLKRRRTYYRRWGLKKYGLTIEQYETMLEQQGGVCAVCKNEPGIRLLPVDHCHKTGKVRSLLCNNCNVILGLANDNQKLLKQLIDYLVQHA